MARSRRVERIGLNRVGDEQGIVEEGLSSVAVDVPLTLLAPP